jgi:hypothetical protein
MSQPQGWRPEVSGPGPTRMARRVLWLIVVLAHTWFGPAFADAAHAGSAAALRARYAELSDRLAHSPFGRPLALESRQTGDLLQGEVYAAVEHRFVDVRDSLKDARQWCDVLILHLNVKSCRPGPGGGLTVYLGRKFSQPLSDAFRLDFAFHVAADAPDYLEVALRADKGPFGTRDYGIRLEAAPLDATHSFLVLSYSFAYGLTARIAMQAYLATLGSGKVGFTVIGKRADGTPEYVGELRGVIERNIMRYYLAIDAYLGAMSAPPAARPEKSMRDWFAATERYAPQLHEIGQAEYLEMKRAEILRQARGR